jgi:hypothetical protein
MGNENNTENNNKEEVILEAKVVEVATQTEPVIQLKDGQLVSHLQATVIILNKLDRIENLVG